MHARTARGAHCTNPAPRRSTQNAGCGPAATSTSALQPLPHRPACNQQGSKPGLALPGWRAQHAPPISPAPAMPAMIASISCSLTCAGRVARRAAQSGGSGAVAAAATGAAASRRQEGRKAASDAAAASGTAGSRRREGRKAAFDAAAASGTAGSRRREVRGKRPGALLPKDRGGGPREHTRGGDLTTKQNIRVDRGTGATHRLVHHGQELLLVGVDGLQHGGLGLAQLLRGDGRTRVSPQVAQGKWGAGALGTA